MTLRRVPTNVPADHCDIGTLKTWDVRQRLGEIHAPTLVISGQYDEATPVIAETVHQGIAGSEWVLGSEGRVIRIALHGLMGPITVKEKKWDMIMPGLGIFEDEQIAGILTYIRREWGNTADPVTPAAVKAVRDQFPNREDLWTEAELLRVE